MNILGFITFALIVANFIISYKGFSDYAFFEAWSFKVDEILNYKQYKRLLSSGFLHVSWLHLLFNMFSLYAFSGALEIYLGGIEYLVIYMAGLLGGNFLSLLIHRHQGDYSSVGASGAVCGIIYASIALFPGVSIGFFGLPLSVPGWLYGLGFVLYSIYGIRSRRDNIGHDAHLGGALAGLAVAVLLHPSALADNFFTVALIVIPTIGFIYFILRRPGALLIDQRWRGGQKDFYSIDHRYNADKRAKQEQVNAVLDKINRRGVGSLSRKERQILDDFSKFR